MTPLLRLGTTIALPFATPPTSPQGEPDADARALLHFFADDINATHQLQSQGGDR